MSTASDPDTSHIVLVGLMGSGKSTIGRKLAKSLGRPFLDSDQLIERRTGRTVRQIFETDGEATFRAIEREVLHDALVDPTPSVVAAAGGAVLDAGSRSEMSQLGFVIWLKADPAVLAKRVRSGGHRPLLDDDPGAVLEQMASDRDALYAEVADETVDVTSLSMDGAARRVDDLVSALVR